MFLDKLAQVLESEGIGTVGQDIFYYSAPPEIETYVLLMLSGDGIPFDNERPGYYNTKYQVIVRSPSYEEGATLANDVKEALTFYGRDVDNISFKHSMPRDEPRPYRRNESAIVEFSNYFLVSFVKE